jgi:hypothetical protein
MKAGTPSRRASKLISNAFGRRCWPGVILHRGGLLGGGFHVGINKRFVAFLRAQYAGEIAIMMEIAPDYLAITRQAVETTSPPGEIAETGNGG